MELESEGKIDGIRLRFVNHPGIFSSLVRLAQLGYWATHVEAITPEGEAISSWFQAGGVTVRPASYDAGGFNRQQLLSLKATPGQAAAFYAFLRAQVGKPYDALAIVAFVAGRDWQAPDSWFCSELIAAGLAQCGLFPKMLAVSFSRITVKDTALLASALANEAG